MAAMAILIIYSPTAGFNWFILLITFLILGVLATKYKSEYKRSLGISEGTRTAKNVISNGIIAFIAATFGLYGPFIGAIATATADTLASEIGITQTPRLITTFKKVNSRTPQSNRKSIAQLKLEFEAMLRAKNRKMITGDIGIYNA